MGRLHVTPREGKWAVKHEGNDTPLTIEDTQERAERFAKDHAREHGDAEVVLHDHEGRIRDSDTMDPAHESDAPDTVR